MSVTLMDYRDTTGFYGYRLYMSKKPHFCIQKYYSFKRDGKFVSKAVQKAIYQEALDFEAGIRKQYDFVRQGSVFRKQTSGPLAGQRTVQTPSRISGLNFNLSHVKPEYNINVDWEAVGKTKHYDIQFHTYKPFITVWRGHLTGKSHQFRFANKHEYYDQYKAAIVQYSKIYIVTSEEIDLMYEYQPTWHLVRDFILAEAIRLYDIRPLGKTKI